MQPCPTCGGMGIDANGYCTQCRTYRGLPQAMPPSSGVPYSGAPYSGAPYSGAPAQAPYGGYPTSPGPTYQQQPTSSGPTYQQPTSGGAAFQGTTYGGAYGAPTTPPPQKRRNSFMVPLLALCGVLAVVVVAIVVVVVVKSGGSDTPGGGGSNQAALVDQCVVGTWEMTSYREDVAVPEVGPVPFTLTGKGATMKFTKDGKGVQDFGDGTTFTGDVTVSGQSATINLKITGDIKYDFRTNDGVMSYSNLVSTGKATVSAPATGQTETEDFKGSSDPSKYTCKDDKMTMSTSLYQSELKRTSSTA